MPLARERGRIAALFDDISQLVSRMARRPAPFLPAWPLTRDNPEGVSGISIGFTELRNGERCTLYGTPNSFFSGAIHGSYFRQAPTDSLKMGMRTCSELEVRTARPLS